MEYEVEDFEILTTILSALKWQEKTGDMKMVTDKAGARWYRENGLDGLWIRGIDEGLEGLAIDASMFWAAGKLYALARESAPVAVIDTDFIVWDEILFDALPDLAVIHDEDLYPDVYPDPNHFNMKRGYVFDPDWDWRRKAYNAAFYVIKDEELLRYYTKEAIRFMESAQEGGDTLTYMVFAEQRLMAMCAGKLGKEVTLFSNLERLFKDGDGFFTHTWGMKQQMRENEYLRESFCRRCIGRILRDYPHMDAVLPRISVLRKYF